MVCGAHPFYSQILCPVGLDATGRTRLKDLVRLMRRIPLVPIQVKRVCRVNTIAKAPASTDAVGRRDASSCISRPIPKEIYLCCGNSARNPPSSNLRGILGLTRDRVSLLRSHHASLDRGCRRRSAPLPSPESLNQFQYLSRRSSARDRNLHLCHIQLCFLATYIATGDVGVVQFPSDHP